MLVNQVLKVVAQPPDKEVGIEIELEGRNLPREHDLAYYWKTEMDGSLRGESTEYVVKEPIPRKNLEKVVNYLYKRLEGAELTVSGRAGIHVHVNCQHMTMTQVYNYICLYLMVEDMLVDYCGQDRKGNHFCLRAKDAEYLIDFLVQTVEDQYWAGFNNHMVRYAALNVCALAKYGSLEFRAMRSPIDSGTLLTWVDMLLHLKDAAMVFDSPKEILRQFSLQGTEKFLATILGKNVEVLNTDERERRNVLEAMWRVQEIAYCKADWAHLNLQDNKKKKKTKEVSIEEMVQHAAAAPLGDWGAPPDWAMPQPQRPGAQILDQPRRAPNLQAQANAIFDEFDE